MRAFADVIWCFSALLFNNIYTARPFYSVANCIVMKLRYVLATLLLLIPGHGQACIRPCLWLLLLLLTSCYWFYGLMLLSIFTLPGLCSRVNVVTPALHYSNTAGLTGTQRAKSQLRLWLFCCCYSHIVTPVHSNLSCLRHIYMQVNHIGSSDSVQVYFPLRV
jgi:hypothetical protein